MFLKKHDAASLSTDKNFKEDWRSLNVRRNRIVSRLQFVFENKRRVPGISTYISVGFLQLNGNTVGYYDYEPSWNTCFNLLAFRSDIHP